MSFPEYRQKPEDHRTCLLLVHPVGSFISKDSLSKLWYQLNALETVTVTKDGRSLSVRFVLNHPVENNEWGDFQYHRKVLGLICVAQYNESVMGSDLEKQYSDLKNLYDSTLLDSRLVILGLPRVTTQPSNEPIRGSPRDDILVIEPDHYNDNDLMVPDLLDRYQDGLHHIASNMSDVTRRRILSYLNTEEAISYLNLDIEYMCQSMFYVLESKRLTAMNSPSRQPPIITAPFENPSAINTDLESKAVRSRFAARYRKRVGDLCLLLDLSHEAVVQYSASLELLKASADEFWIAGALEGLAVASNLVLINQEKATLSVTEMNMRRTSSFNGGGGRSSPGLLLDPSISLQNSFNQLDLASSTKPKLTVTLNDIISKYRDAISFYNKFSAAAIIEMEASLKATRLLIDHKKTKMAAEFLHHVAYVNLDESSSYNERVERYDVMGDLYHQLKFHRKSSFFKRVAAMHCVSPVLPTPAWSECYDLLLQAFPGFKMTFNPSDYRQPGRFSGWPGIRLRIFQELIYAARQLGNNAVTARHVALCLHTMFDCMFSKEIVDLVHLLETFTRIRLDDGLPVTTDTGLVLPPVPFSSFPLFSYFEVLKLTPQLEPHKWKQALPNDSVFIYSPMNFNRKLSRSQSVAEYEFCWVEGNPGSVEVTLYNPLPLELRITDLSLIVEGLKFQSYPSSHTLPPESGPHTINIMGSPRSRGTLRILGYQMTLFGVLSRCLFSDLSHIKQNVFIVEVAPVLPSLHISSELPKSPYMVTGGDNRVLTSAILQIYVGEQRECHIKLKNNGFETITKMDVMLHSDKYQDILGRILTPDTQSLQNCLPLQPGSVASLTVKTIGSMKLADLPEDSLMSPTNETEGKHRASSALIESQLKITYTGEEAERMHYHRECVMAVDTVLIPSINIISQNVQSVSSSACRVLYEVFNESNMALDIKSLDSSVSLKPMQSDWIYCNVDKCGSCSSLEVCRQVISNSVSLSWSSSERQRSGLVSSERLEWDDAELDKVRRRPFGVTNLLQTESSLRYAIGEPIHLTYQISNTTEFSFTEVRFHIVVFQEISSKRTEVEVDSAFVHIGPSTRYISKFVAGQTAEVKLAVAIFYSGQYTLECQCVWGVGEPVHGIDPGISVSIT